MNPKPRGRLTVGTVLICLAINPYRHLIRRWNWKAAFLSSILRGVLILCANISAGPESAVGAMLAESCYRALTSGFCSAFIQAFRFAKPVWAASVVPMILIPFIADSLEFAMHGLRGTQRLGATAAASVIFTSFSALFELFVMRHGVLVVGQNRKSLTEDLKRIPMLLLDFLREGLQLLSAPSRLSGALIARRPPATRMIKGFTAGASASTATEPED